MAFPSNLEIARNAALKPIEDVGNEMGLGSHLLEPYGHDVMKISLDAIEELADRPRAKYVVVTAITPTPLGEGKTTTTVGLGQAFSHIGQARQSSAIRQPSMGPTFGIKGGAAGGGYSQVVPMEKLNLHLTGDFHAVTAATQPAERRCSTTISTRATPARPRPARITWRRVLDVNDRALRNIVTGLGPRDGRRAARDRLRHHRRVGGDGHPRADDVAGRPAGAVSDASWSATPPVRRPGHGRGCSTRPGRWPCCMREAIKPNLLQTLENTPARPRGPFGNIAHGNSSIVADLIGMRTAATTSSPRPASVPTWAPSGSSTSSAARRALHPRRRGGRRHRARPQGALGQLPRSSPGRPLPPELLEENPDEVAGRRRANLRKQIENMKRPRRHPGRRHQRLPHRPSQSEHEAIREVAEAMGAPRRRVCTHFADGGARGRPSSPRRSPRRVPTSRPSSRFLYPDDASLREKIETVATKVYGADGVEFSSASGEPAARPSTNEQRLRPPPRVHRQDSSVDLRPTLP